MKWSKRAISRAGDALVSPTASPEDVADAEEKVNYWREVHLEPLRLLFDDLDRHVHDMGDVLVAGRIKKLDTIKDKLRRSDTPSQLRNMYDIAGCRVVAPDLATLERLSRRLIGLPQCDEGKSGPRDYIAHPRSTGYRSRHLIFRYECAGAGCELNAELQLRTELQHAWATAVEMYDLAVPGSRLKFNEGENPAGRFFRAASRLICLREEGLEGSSEWRKAQATLRSIAASSRVMDVLGACSQSVTVLGNDVISLKDSYCLVDIDIEVQTVTVDEFAAGEAVHVYFQREAKADEAHNVVLVKGSSVDQLRKAYPNYFGDISSFVDLVEQAIAE